MPSTHQAIATARRGRKVSLDNRGRQIYAPLVTPDDVPRTATEFRALIDALNVPTANPYMTDDTPPKIRIGPGDI